LYFLKQHEISFEGYEMQKGLEGISSHEQKIVIPILPNAQDMQAFSLVVENLFRKHPKMHGFLIAGHGLYTWGSNLKIARRQVETFEFLFRCRALEISGV
jgi:methylthioribulose-1-phosphate dehydratase